MTKDARAMRSDAWVACAGWLATGLALCATGCGTDVAAGLKCVPGRVTECACSGGGQGFQTCSHDGAYGVCSCFLAQSNGAGGTSGASGAGGMGGTGGGSDTRVQPGTACQILGATADCACGARVGSTGCFSTDSGAAWGPCRCPDVSTGGDGGASGNGTGGSGGDSGAGGNGGDTGTGGTGGGGGLGGMGGFGGAGAGCPDGMLCLFSICVDNSGNLPSCAQAGASCKGSGTCVQNSGTLSCFVPCTQ